MARTIFVNPTRRKRRKAHSKRRRNAMAPRFVNPRRRRRAHRSRRRRNAGVAPFVRSNPRRRRRSRRNPMILNPRRRSRRNPGLKMPGVKTILNTTMNAAGGAAIGAAVNVLGINQIGNTWLRNAARVAAALVAGMVLPDKLATAAGGAIFYPAATELATMLVPSAAAPTSADLEDIGADLEDVLDELDADLEGF